MEAPKTVDPSKEKEFLFKLGNEDYYLCIINCNDTVKFSLRNEDKFVKYEKSLGIKELNNISNWFKLFDTLDEAFEDIINLVENKQINISTEENISKLNFSINMEKIKQFEIILDKIELSNDEKIKYLIKENSKLKNREKNYYFYFIIFVSAFLVLLISKIVNLSISIFNYFSEEQINSNYQKEEENIHEEENEIWKSNIINDEDKKTLNNWINNDKEIKLLYKATRDGDSYKDFYRLCENKWPTITIIITTKGYKFGFYTSLPWKNPQNNNYSYDSKKCYVDYFSFIFSLDKKRKYSPKKDYKYQICMYNDKGPSIGYENNLQISNNFLRDYSYNNLVWNTQSELRELNGGEYSFTIKDYEVYSIDNDN